MQPCRQRQRHRRWRGGLENAIAAGSGAMWLYGPQAPQPADTCTCAERLHEAITADYNDMIYAATRE
jgi:hypothetical protein